MKKITSFWKKLNELIKIILIVALTLLTYCVWEKLNIPDRTSSNNAIEVPTELIDPISGNIIKINECTLDKGKNQCEYFSDKSYVKDINQITEILFQQEGSLKCCSIYIEQGDYYEGCFYICK